MSRGATRVAKGTFGQFSIEDLLAAISLSRQVLLVELEANEQPIGEFVVKGGRVLSAKGGDGATGVEAFRTLILAQGEGFKINRLPPQEDYDEPLGTISGLAGGADPDISEVDPTVVRYVQTDVDDEDDEYFVDDEDSEEEDPTQVIYTGTPEAEEYELDEDETKALPAERVKELSIRKRTHTSRPAEPGAQEDEVAALLTRLSAALDDLEQPQRSWFDIGLMMLLIALQVATLITVATVLVVMWPS